MEIGKQKPSTQVRHLSRAAKLVQLPGAEVDLTQPDAVRVLVRDPGKTEVDELMDGAEKVHSATDDEGILGVTSGVVGVEGKQPDEVAHIHKMGEQIVDVAIDVPLEEK